MRKKFAKSKKVCAENNLANPKVIFLCLVHNKLRAKLSQLTAAATAAEQFLCGWHQN